MKWIRKNCLILRPPILFSMTHLKKLITQFILSKYMVSWTNRVGLVQNWRLTHEVRQDKDGIFTDWEWREILITPFSGSAIITITDNSVNLEWITYFKR